jgi:dTDP-4-amino-4,6-dideoxygalactose transaminase
LKVQLLDLASQYRKIKKEVLSEVRKVCDSQHYVLGENVSRLEAEIAEYCGSKYAVGVASGTDAILLSLMAAGVVSGDKVITTPYTFFSTASSISRLGATPVFVDIHPKTYNIDPALLEELLKRRSSRGVKGIIPVHLFGQCSPMTRIKRLVRGRGITVIEDAAQSIGAEFKGAGAGTLGDMGCFSFYPTKNLGCFGDGGMVTTNNLRRAERLRMLRVHGSRGRYYYDAIGICSRLDEIQAAVLRVKLRYLDAWSDARRNNAGLYNRLIKKAGLLDIVTPPYVEDGNLHVYNQYVLRVKHRDGLRRHLKNRGVGTEIYYPMPLHLQKCFKDLGYKKGDFPVSERMAKEALALPIYPELREAEQKYVVSCIAGFYNKLR